MAKITVPKAIKKPISVPSAQEEEITNEYIDTTILPPVTTEVPETKAQPPKKETVLVDVEFLQSLQKQISELSTKVEETAWSQALQAYAKKRNKRAGKDVSLSIYKNLVVTGWEMLEDDPTWNEGWLGKKQRIRVHLENETSVDIPYGDFIRTIRSKRTPKIPVITSGYKDNPYFAEYDGDEQYDPLGYDTYLTRKAELDHYVVVKWKGVQYEIFDCFTNL